MRTHTELYDQDFYAWRQTTADLIRVGKWHDLDQEALAEEIESLGKSDWRELASRIAVLLRHLLNGPAGIRGPHAATSSDAR